MCNKSVLENSRTLNPASDYNKNQKMRNKAVDNYPYAFEFVTECYKTYETCYKATDIHPFTIKYVPD